MSKRTVAVLMGGASPEHDISLLTGRNVAAALDRSKYDVRPVVVGRDGLWLLSDTSAPVELGAAVEFLQREIDVVFIAIHGPYGEDGRMQGFLDLIDVPYTGSGVVASSVAIDKSLCKDVVARHGVPVPAEVLVSARAWKIDRRATLIAIENELGYPCVVKPTAQGSSVAMGIPKEAETLAALVTAALEYGPTVMVEQYVEGTEISVAVFGSEETDSLQTFPVVEIVPVTGEFFDFESKYTEGGAQEIIPARISEAETASAQQMAVTVHTTLGCRGMSRSDMIVSKDDIYFIEVNSIPGMTALSIYPQAAAAAGIGFSELMDMFVEDACTVHKMRSAHSKELG